MPNSISSKLKPLMGGSQLLNIIKFILPLIATNILQEFYQASDVMIVGLSPEPDAIGAVGAPTAFLSLIRNLFLGFSVGINVIVARHIGKNDKERISRAAHTGICMSLIFGVIGAMLGIALSRTVLVAMGYSGKLLELALSYSYIYLACIPLLSLTNGLSAILQAVGNTRVPLYTLSATGLLNVGLNLLLVLGCNLSVEGVAIATAIANLISAVVLWIYLARRSDACRVSFSALRVSKEQFGEIASVGFPAGIQNALFSISNLLISSSIVQVNNAVTPPGSAYEPVLKGHSASASIESFIFQALGAVTVTASVFTARSVGAGDYRRARQVFCEVSLISLIISVVMSTAFILLRDPLLLLYGVENSGDALATIAYDAALAKMLWKWPLFFVYALMNAASGTLRGLGRSSLAAIIALFGTCVFRVVWIFTVFLAFPTLESIFISYPISWGLTGVVTAAIVLRIFNKNIKTKAEKAL